MSESTIYWITRLDSVNMVIALVIVALIISLVAWAVMAFVAIDSGLKINKTKWNVAAWMMLLGLVIASLALVFVPSTKEMVAIKVIPTLANSRLADKSLQNIDALLDVCVEQVKARKKD